MGEPYAHRQHQAPDDDKKVHDEWCKVLGRLPDKRDNSSEINAKGKNDP